MQACVVIIAVLALNLGGTQPHGNTADANVVLSRSIAHDCGLPVVADLGGYLASSTDAGTRSAAGRGGEAGGGSLAADDLEGGAHFGGALLGQEAGVLILSAVAPDGSLLLAEKGDVARRLGAATARARGGRATKVGGGRGTVGGGWRNTRGGAEGVY